MQKVTCLPRIVLQPSAPPVKIRKRSITRETGEPVPKCVDCGKAFEKIFRSCRIQIVSTVTTRGPNHKKGIRLMISRNRDLFALIRRLGEKRPRTITTRSKPVLSEALPETFGQPGSQRFCDALAVRIVGGVFGQFRATRRRAMWASRPQPKSGVLKVAIKMRWQDDGQLHGIFQARLTQVIPRRRTARQPCSPFLFWLPKRWRRRSTPFAKLGLDSYSHRR